MTRPDRQYHYRGLIERGWNYQWCEGYSANSSDGFPLYPWCTRRECRAEAKLDGVKAVFYRDGKL
jgi:hypothetical protein